MCEVLGVHRSAYYAWLKRPMSKRHQEDIKLVEVIKKIHRESYNSYGVRRIKKQMADDGIECGKNRVSRLMKENGIVSKHARKYKATTNSNHNFNIAPNLLNQDFNVNEPNKVYVGDITYIATDEGWLYLSIVEDLFNREVVGWSMDSTMTKKLVIDSLKASVIKEKPDEGLIFHSDRGVQYASYDFQDFLREKHFRQSMSAKGNCYDNACAESFFASLKKDMLFGRRFRTRQEAKSVIVEYIELFYNPRRLHSSLGYKSPKRFKDDYYSKLKLFAA